jgi:hypothetical protein
MRYEARMQGSCTRVLVLGENRSTDVEPKLEFNDNYGTRGV